MTQASLGTEISCIHRNKDGLGKNDRLTGKVHTPWKVWHKGSLMVSQSILEIVDQHAPVTVPTQAYFLYTFFFLFLIQKELSWQEKTFKKKKENLLHTSKQQVNHSTDNKYLYYIKKIQNVHPASFLLLLFFMLRLCIQLNFSNLFNCTSFRLRTGIHGVGEQKQDGN